VQKKEDAIPLRRVCVNLREGDFEWLKRSRSESPSETIREIVSRFRKTVEEKVSRKMPSIHDIELDIEDVL
jgi:hypothetical protein